MLKVGMVFKGRGKIKELQIVEVNRDFVRASYLCAGDSIPRYFWHFKSTFLVSMKLYKLHLIGEEMGWD